MLAYAPFDGGDPPGVSVSEQGGHLILQNREVRQYLRFEIRHHFLHVRPVRPHRGTFTNTALENLE